jgi:PKD repeat protein
MTKNRIMNSTMMRFMVSKLLLAVCALTLAMQPFNASSVVAATTLPVKWSAGGLSAGNDSAGQAARIASDYSGNIAVVSGPALARDLAVTSYTASGSLRWQRTVSPVSGTFRGDWVVATPNGDFAAVGTSIDSKGNPIGLTIVRYSTDGTLRWRSDLARTRPGVARLIADNGDNTYLAFNSIGDGQDIQLHKYNASGVLLWSQVITTGSFANNIATSLALSPNGVDVVLTGDIIGGSRWITALFDTATGSRRWLVEAAEGIAALDVVSDNTRVYVTGMGNVGTNGFLTVIAYDRITGARLWRTDANPPTGSASGSRIALAPDGSLVVAGQTSSGGYFDWWVVAMDTNGTVKWQARRDAALSGDEIPASIFVLADGTAVVSGTGGPTTRDVLGNSYMQGVTAGYSSTGVLQWEAFSKLPAVWATPLPNGNICATGGYDALVTCWQVPGTTNYQPVLTATPGSGSAPLNVNFTRSVTGDPNGPIISYVTLNYGDSSPGISGTLDFGDGTSTFTLNQNSSHIYQLPGAYNATLTVFYTDNTSISTTATIIVSPSVTPAQLPVITATPVSGTAPLAVTFTSSATSASSGPLINSYAINYGDGTSNQFILNFGNGTPTFTGTSSHTYTTSGTFPVTLTVTYNNATTATAGVTITVNPVVTQTLRSSAINLSTTLQRNRVNVTGNVSVKDSNGTAIPGAVVSSTWAIPGGGTVRQSATTNSTGIARFNTSGGRGTYTLNLNSISKTGYSFDSANSVLSKSITR